MKVYFHNFFEDLDLTFFTKIIGSALNEDTTRGTFEESDILLESCFGNQSALYKKAWRYTLFFSGESDRRLLSVFRVHPDHLKKYTCVLKGEQSHENIINVPLYNLYTYTYNYTQAFIQHKRDSTRFSSETLTRIPPKDVCVIVSNSMDHEGRNLFFERLEEVCPIEYAGQYKTNVERIIHPHMTPGFIEFVSQYKFIITMENSKNKDYITEKILEGFAANTIPVYWGSDHITDYFNEERFINVKTFSDTHITDAIARIQFLLKDTNAYLEMINKPIYKNNTIPMTIDSISNDIRRHLNLPTNQTKTLITFGGPSQGYRNSVHRIVKEAKSLGYFDTVHGYTDLDLKNTPFWTQHASFIEAPPRGYGCWIWKPYFIKKELATLKENDILIYCDAGCMINPQGLPRLTEYVDMLNNNKDNYGILSFQLEFIEQQYTKKAIFEHFKTPDAIQHMPQCLASVVLIKKNAHSVNIIEQWYETATNNYNLLDFKTLSSDESSRFIENRNDQSILSVLVNTQGSIKLKDETYFGGAWETEGAMYPLWVRRIK